jgi:hypothetical protein
MGAERGTGLSKREEKCSIRKAITRAGQKAARK